MARIYRPVWDQIKATTKAELTAHQDKVATIIQGVKKIKSEENAVRRKIGLIPYSKLVIEQEELGLERVKIKFKLLYDTRF